MVEVLAGLLQARFCCEVKMVVLVVEDQQLTKEILLHQMLHLLFLVDLENQETIRP